MVCSKLPPSITGGQTVQGFSQGGSMASMPEACSITHLASDMLYGVLKADLVKHWLLLQSVQGLSRGDGMAVGQQLMPAQGACRALQHPHCLPHKKNGLSNADRHTWRKGLH